MEKIVWQSLLYDFYGELLNEHQRQVYEDYVFHDFSISEIARERSITRQGIHDLVKRCNNILEGYEEKLHLVEKFLKAREKVNTIHRLAAQSREEGRDAAAVIARIEEISNEILEEF